MKQIRLASALVPNETISSRDVAHDVAHFQIEVGEHIMHACAVVHAVVHTQAEQSEDIISLCNVAHHVAHTKSDLCERIMISRCCTRCCTPSKGVV